MKRLALSLVVVGGLASACGGSPQTVASTDETTAAAAAADDTTTTAPMREVEIDADVLIDAAWATTEAGSSRSTFQAVVATEGGDEVTFGGEGSVDFANQRGSLDLDISHLLEDNGIEGVDGSFDMIFDGNVTYLRAPLLNVLFSAPTPWLQYDVAALPRSGSSSFGDGLRSLTQFAGHDPVTPLDLLTGVQPGTVRGLGEATIDDGAVNHYAARVDLPKALATTPAAVRDRLVERLGTDELDIEVFLDAEGRLRRLSYVETAGRTTMTVTYEYFDFATEVSPAIPAADEVSSLFDAVPAL